MRKIHFTLLLSLLFSLFSYAQTEQDQDDESVMSKLQQQLNPQNEKIKLAFNQAQNHAYKIDEIEAYKIKYDELYMLLKKADEIFTQFKKESKPAELDLKFFEEATDRVRNNYFSNLERTINQLNNKQNKFIALVEMADENKIIESEADLFKIWEVYLSFEKLTEHHNYLSYEITKVYNQLEYEKKNNADVLNCERIMGYLKFCDEFDSNNKSEYILSKDSVVKSYFSLPAKYQSIKIIPKLEKEEDDDPSDTVEERNRKIAIRTSNASKSFLTELFISFKGHYSDVPWGSIFDQYSTDFTKRLRGKITEIKERKNCN